MRNKRGLIPVLLLLLSLAYSVEVNADIGLIENSTWQTGLTAIFHNAMAFGDIDNDGDLDLVMVGCTASCSVSTKTAQVYLNNGTSLVRNSTWEDNMTGVTFAAAALGDIDNDGDLDLVVSGGRDSINSDRVIIYTNDGTSFQENETWGVGTVLSNSGDVALGDVDNDGRLDLAIFPVAGNLIYINNGTSFYANSTWDQNLVSTGRVAITWVDLDNDNNLDLIVFGISNSKVYINNGTSLVEDSTWEQSMGAMDRVSLAYGDIDNDGDFDFFASSENPCRADIYDNDGTTLTRNSTWEQNLLKLFWGGSAFGDYDNNGKLDFAYTGQCGGTRYVNVFNNTGTNFTRDTTAETNLTGRSKWPVVWVDIDNDNDLDLVMSGDSGTTNVYINNVFVPNTAPSAPSSGFSSVFDNGKLTLSWGQGGDAETPADGLYYNIRVGTCQGCNDTISGIYGGSSGGSGHGGITKGYYGNMMQRRSISIRGLSASTDYNWSVQAIDTGLLAGAWSTEQTYTTTADIIDPVITLNAPADLFNTSNVTVIINVTVSDETGIGNVSLWSNYSGTWEVNQTNHSQANNVAYVFMNQSWSTEGTYLWGVEACDGTNNCVNSVNRTFTIDLTAPVILTANITPSNNSFTSDNTPFIGFNATDWLGVNESSVTIAINDTVYNSTTISCTGTTGGKSCNFTLTAGLGDSNFSITFNITDFVGNRASTTTNFTVDTTPPSTNATLMAANDTDLDGNIEISWQNDTNEVDATYRIYRHSSQITSNSIGSATLLYNESNIGNSFEDNTTTGDNATTYWYALVTIDRAGNTNTSAPSNSLNSTANDTIRPLPIINLTITGSGATATLTWLAIERDVSGNADNNGM